MRATLERIEKNQVSLHVEVEADQFEDALEKAYRKVVKRINVPGFRKGRAPRSILEAYFGKQVLYEEALDIILPQAYREAVKETDIEPIEQPKISVVQMEEGQPLIFDATVEVLPEVKLGDYKGVAAVMPKVEVGEEDVEAHLKYLQQRHARLVDGGEGPVKEGDIAVVNYEGFVSEKRDDRLCGEEVSVEVGLGRMFPGFEEQLAGMKVGEEKEFDLVIAEKEAHFKVKLVAIKNKELSPIDDEFARDVSECSSLQELKDQIRNKLEEIKQYNARRVFAQRVVDKVVEQAEVEVPESLIRRQLQQEYVQFAQNVLLQGMDLEQYLKATNKTWEALQEELRDRAKDVMKRSLVLGAVARAEGIKVEPEELDKEIERLALQYNMDASKFRQELEKKGEVAAIEDRLLLEKVQKFLTDHARAEEEPESTEREENKTKEVGCAEEPAPDSQAGEGASGDIQSDGDVRERV